MAEVLVSSPLSDCGMMASVDCEEVIQRKRRISDTLLVFGHQRLSEGALLLPFI